jgi:uncharacterized repeat protein (TIGR03803 family)
LVPFDLRGQCPIRKRCGAVKIVAKVVKIFPSLTISAALFTIHITSAQAQTLNAIYNFAPATYADASSGGWGFTNVDGAHPYCRPALSGSTLYGTTQVGGNGSGTIFSVNTDGTGYTVLHTFIDSAGSCPYAGLLLSGSKLYGTTPGGGGIVFSMNTDGSDFTVLHSGGGSPLAEVTLAGNTLYGTTEDDVFSVNTDGSGYAEIHSFTETYYNTSLKLYTNGDGSDSWGSVVLSSNVLYGTASDAGPNGCGTLFAVNADGSSYMVLHAFAGGADGATPLSGLVMVGNVLYGTTYYGGAAGQGTVFSINADGSGYTVLHNFGGSPDGANPRENMTFAGGMLYGTTLNGGTGAGTVFVISTNGSSFAVLRALDDNTDGEGPQGGLAMSGNTFYGTASYGGTNGSGTVFSLKLPVPAIAALALQGANLMINTTNGMAGGAYTVVTSADCSMPLCQWTPLASGNFDTNGNSTLIATNSVNPSARQGFYALRLK